MLYDFSTLGTAEIIVLSGKILVSMQNTSYNFIRHLNSIGSPIGIKTTLGYAASYQALHQILENMYQQERYDAFASQEQMKHFLDITNFSPYYLPINVGLAISSLSTDYNDYDNQIVMSCFKSQIPPELYSYLGFSSY